MTSGTESTSVASQRSIVIWPMYHCQVACSTDVQQWQGKLDYRQLTAWMVAPEDNLMQQKWVFVDQADRWCGCSDARFHEELYMPVQSAYTVFTLELEANEVWWVYQWRDHKFSDDRSDEQLRWVLTKAGVSSRHQATRPEHYSISVVQSEMYQSDYQRLECDRQYWIANLVKLTEWCKTTRYSLLVNINFQVTSRAHFTGSTE